MEVGGAVRRGAGGHTCSKALQRHQRELRLVAGASFCLAVVEVRAHGAGRQLQVVGDLRHAQAARQLQEETENSRAQPFMPGLAFTCAIASAFAVCAST